MRLGSYEYPISRTPRLLAQFCPQTARRDHVKGPVKARHNWQGGKESLHLGPEMCYSSDWTGNSELTSKLWFRCKWVTALFWARVPSRDQAETCCVSEAKRKRTSSSSGAQSVSNIACWHSMKIFWTLLSHVFWRKQSSPVLMVFLQQPCRAKE